MPRDTKVLTRDTKVLWRQALPAIFIFEGDSVRKLPDWEMSTM
jgi:hypothetical protein